MNSTQGMDVEEVRQVAQRLRDVGTEISQLETQLTGGLADVVWTGPDADRCRAQWSDELVPAMQQIVALVQELGDTAERNASEQDAASA